MTGGFFAILDDIAMLLDDAAAVSKVAVKKSAGVLGDDLAVNAEKASGFHASRELPVLWAITKGSLLNKAILLPLAFLLSAFAPWLITPILLLGGIYLSFEGVEKIYHAITDRHNHTPTATHSVSKEELIAAEKGKITSAIRTDFILSIEIIMIALGTVMDESFGIQLMVVSLIAFLATIGVYGLVALLVRMDDMGLYLIDQSEHKGLLALIGKLLVAGLPRVIKLLTIIGTAAMLLVGGGMFVHHIPAIHELLHALPILVAELLSGLVVGAAAVAIFQLLFHKKK